NADVDAVVIASPPLTHKDITLRAVAAGKHVFCEKPMALSVADCDEMLAAAAAAAVKLCVGQVLRLVGPYRKALELIGSENLGAPSGIAVARCSGYSAQGSFGVAWRQSGETSGGLLLEINAHEFDFLRAVCGEPESVHAQGARVMEDGFNYNDLWYINVRFRSGAIGVLHSSRSCFVRMEYFTIQCPGGTISTYDQVAALTLATTAGESRAWSPEDLENYEDPFRYELRSWLEAITDDTPMIVDGTDGRMAVAMAAAAHQSARSGEVVAV
ncbi:MAG: Gfo/Idh/MocA family oxidoreductase, partial [Lentisphaeria bacterium]|nr:Gfo/Idh/MocA family oxidoreductase [Lentisphaeria bacterium]